MKDLFILTIVISHLLLALYKTYWLFRGNFPQICEHTLNRQITRILIHVAIVIWGSLISR